MAIPVLMLAPLALILFASNTLAFVDWSVNDEKNGPIGNPEGGDEDVEEDVEKDGPGLGFVTRLFGLRFPIPVFGVAEECVEIERELERV